MKGKAAQTTHPRNLCKASWPLIVALLSTVTFSIHSPEACAAPLKLTNGRTLSSTDVSSQSSVYSFSMGNAVQILKSSTDTSIYDPITMSTLKRLKDEAQPLTGPDDLDPAKTRSVAEKAFAIQAGRSFTDLMNGSELQDSFRSFQRGLSEIQDIFRYSILRDDKGISVTRNTNGQKLVEFNLEISASQGFDPQIRMGDNLRVRYDYTDHVPLLEYGFRF